MPTIRGPMTSCEALLPLPTRPEQPSHLIHLGLVGPRFCMHTTHQREPSAGGVGGDGPSYYHVLRTRCKCKLRYAMLTLPSEALASSTHLICTLPYLTLGSHASREDGDGDGVMAAALGEPVVQMQVDRLYCRIGARLGSREMKYRYLACTLVLHPLSRLVSSPLFRNLI